jgi:hypothetical protein
MSEDRAICFLKAGKQSFSAKERFRQRKGIALPQSARCLPVVCLLSVMRDLQSVTDVKRGRKFTTHI